MEREWTFADYQAQGNVLASWQFRFDSRALARHLGRSQVSII